MSVHAMDSNRYTVNDRPPRRLVDFLLRWETILVWILLVVVFVNSLLSPYFLDLYNLSDATVNFSEQAIIALAMALLILVREIDLSVAAIIAFCSLLMGLCSNAGYGPAALVVVGLSAGALCGMLNGALVAGLGLPSIVVTIGTMSLFRGVPQVVLGDQAITHYPAAFESIGQGHVLEWPPIPISFALFLCLAVIVGVVLHLTRYGRAIYAIGSNPTAARFSGLNVARTRFFLFVVSGVLSGLAAVLLTARIGSTRPNIAIGWELTVVTMVVLGGVSISGGSGSIPGVVLSTFVIGMLTWGMSLANIPTIEISVFLGILLIVSIAVPSVTSFLRDSR